MDIDDVVIFSLIATAINASAALLLIMLFFRKTAARIKSSSIIFQRPYSYLSIVSVVLWFVLASYLGIFDKVTNENLLIPLVSKIILGSAAYLVVFYTWVCWTTKWYGKLSWIIMEIVILVAFATFVFSRNFIMLTPMNS
jgi:hypothetical protein